MTPISLGEPEKLRNITRNELPEPLGRHRAKKNDPEIAKVVS
jgi:hypothetical protein